jgi:hypothetical protein
MLPKSAIWYVLCYENPFIGFVNITKQLDQVLMFNIF